jgi:hypothetical protein
MSIPMTLAEKAYRTVRHLAGFSLSEAKRRTVNQHMRAYTFADGSILRVYRGGRASVATGPGDYRTYIVGTIRANAWGD